MFTVYVIQSRKGLVYIGQTSDLQLRLERHNSGMSRYTKRDGSWHVVYSEEFHTRTEAMKRERWLKSGKGREFLKVKIAGKPIVLSDS